MLKEASQYDAKILEQNIQKFWDEIDAYSRVRELRKNGKKFFFVDGSSIHNRQDTSWYCLE